MAVEIVTGFQGKPHVTANDTACFNQGVIGSGEYVLNIGKKFSAVVVTNNQIRIDDGEAVMQGVHYRIHPNTYVNVTIENGNQGVKRKDIIVARYTKERSSGIEKIQIIVVKGTPSADNPLVPSLKKGDIRIGTETNEMLLYVVNIDGLNITGITKSFDEVMSVLQVQKMAEDINKKRLQKLSEVMLVTQPGFFVDSLVVKDLINKTPEVIEDNLGRGSRAFKFQSGLMIQVEQIFFTCPAMSAYGSLFLGTYVITTQRKIPFVENKLLLGYATSVYAGDLSISSSYSPNTKTLGRYDFFGHENLAGKEIAVNLMSIGFWK